VSTLVGVARDGDEWVGRAPSWSRSVVFGGVLLGQTTYTAGRELGADDRRIHSLHAYFLRPALASEPIRYRVTPLREGKTFATCRVVAHQKEREVLTALCSFTGDAEAYEYDPPASLAPLGATESMFEDWECCRAGPTQRRADGSFESTSRMWVRYAGPLPPPSDDEALHAALIAFVTDWTWTGARPLHLEGDTRGIISLDHAIWFHRVARADEWLHYDVTSVVNANGRGLLRGAVRGLDGTLRASAAQETKLTRYEEAPAR
jgi:acyl-CoA thioesterase-2